MINVPVLHVNSDYPEVCMCTVTLIFTLNIHTNIYTDILLLCSHYIKPHYTSGWSVCSIRPGKRKTKSAAAVSTISQ